MRQDSTSDGTRRRPVCFVVSPIGQTGTERHEVFAHVLDDLIRPVAETAGFEIVRADEIHHTGPFLRDVVNYLATADVVVADLTGHNPNVFYELGVRHALSRRTILIAREQEDIPADLAQYRTLIYGDALANGDAIRERLAKTFAQMAVRPDEQDSPVLEWLTRSPIPNELRQTYSARVADIGATQEDILRFVVKETRAAGTFVLQGDVAAEFKRGGSETYYRLEQLRLLGFIVKQWDAGKNRFTYALAPDYRRELGLA
jgi:hypothetical protein